LNDKIKNKTPKKIQSKGKKRWNINKNLCKYKIR
jgi:hypothetical protein